MTAYSPSKAVKENCPSASLRARCYEAGPGELVRRSLTVAASTPSPPRETVAGNDVEVDADGKYER